MRDITVKNTNSTNSVNVAGSRITVADSIFTGLGDDPNHVVHDVSVLYLYGNQIIVTGNHFTGASRGAPPPTLPSRLMGARRRWRTTRLPTWPTA